MILNIVSFHDKDTNQFWQISWIHLMQHSLALLEAQMHAQQVLSLKKKSTKKSSEINLN